MKKRFTPPPTPLTPQVIATRHAKTTFRWVFYTMMFAVIIHQWAAGNRTAAIYAALFTLEAFVSYRKTLYLRKIEDDVKVLTKRAQDAILNAKNRRSQTREPFTHSLS